jgi:hypothetical protein
LKPPKVVYVPTGDLISRRRNVDVRPKKVGTVVDDFLSSSLPLSRSRIELGTSQTPHLAGERRLLFDVKPTRR